MTAQAVWLFLAQIKGFSVNILMKLFLKLLLIIIPVIYKIYIYKNFRYFAFFPLSYFHIFI